MEIPNRTHEKNFAHSTSDDMRPVILEEKVKTCINSYRNENGKSPNAVILSDKARTVLLNTKLFAAPSSFSDLQSRDTLIGEEFQLGVYSIDELPEKKRPAIEKRLSETPETIYLGRTNLLGRLKEKSLKEYEFKCSF